jgi:Family of unknown function (DUF6111)
MAPDPESRTIGILRFSGFRVRALGAPRNDRGLEMIRPVLTEIALFVAPFVIYALFLWATKTSVLDRAYWSMKVMLTLTIVAMLLMIGSFIYLGHFTGIPPGATYEPAHVDDGRFIPGRVVR